MKLVTAVLSVAAVAAISNRPPKPRALPSTSKAAEFVDESHPFITWGTAVIHGPDVVQELDPNYFEEMVALTSALEVDSMVEMFPMTTANPLTDGDGGAFIGVGAEDRCATWTTYPLHVTWMVTRIGWFRFKGIGWEEPTILANYTTIPFDGAWHIVPLESSWLPESETLFEEPPVVVAQVLRLDGPHPTHLTVAIRGVTLAEFEMRIVSLDNAPNHAEFTVGFVAMDETTIEFESGGTITARRFEKSPYIMPLHFPHGGQCARPSLFASSTSGSDDANVPAVRDLTEDDLTFTLDAKPCTTANVPHVTEASAIVIEQNKCFQVLGGEVELAPPAALNVAPEVPAGSSSNTLVWMLVGGLSLIILIAGGLWYHKTRSAAAAVGGEEGQTAQTGPGQNPTPRQYSPLPIEFDV